MAWLADRLSRAVERSQQRGRELAKLEELGRAILAAPADASTLPGVLSAHVPGMFSRTQIEIHMDRGTLFAGQSILRHPGEEPPAAASVWDWLNVDPQTHHFAPDSALPWGGQLDGETAMLLAPILDAESMEPVGGIQLSRRWDADAVARLEPAVQSLAAQIASALHRAEVFRIERELAVAGQIQSSFLPACTPELAGYQLAASLEPARETSGDFYDFISLPGGRLGIVIADVADKGMGAALFMAASRTLVRTSALDHDTDPAQALAAANRRILADTRSGLFVTVFYAVVDPIAGTLTYCNAGHNPPYLLRARDVVEGEELTKTGMALGVLEDVTWERRTAFLSPGDRLVLYTDGVTDAENGRGVFYGAQRLLAAARATQGLSAQEMVDGILAEIKAFSAGVDQFDDIALIVLGREP
jgi:serine phosphatase RsbU (regulator of sigma subunit)